MPRLCLHRFALWIGLLALAACATTPPTTQAPELRLQATRFDDLPGWNDDNIADSLAAFRRSCPALTRQGATSSLGIAGPVTAWQQVCARAATIPADATAARAFFTTSFRPYAVSGGDGDTGLFTGYYAPELAAARERQGVYQTPLYGKPSDLIGVDLGLFKSDLKGQHIVGKVAGNTLVPYDDRAAVAQGALQNRAPVLAWVADPVDAFFLEVQGSGRLRLPDGTVMPVGYDGANGRAYVAIGRVLADSGDIPRPVTMPALRAWLHDHPAQAQPIMNRNPSYVFFRPLPDGEPLGALNVPLTAGRSLAVDPHFIPLGVPLWLDTTDALNNPLRRLMIAQDTGGAIKGAVRGDVYWGSGDAAALQAGAMQSRGRFFILLPRDVEPPHD